MYIKKKSIIYVGIFFLAVALLSLIYASSVYFSEDIHWYSNMTAVFHSSLVSGDINNDGDYDIIAMGCTAGGVDTCTTADKIRVYINNQTTFNENSTWESNTTNLGYGSLALGDINNDEKLDLVALGDRGGGNGDIIIYINNGTSFNENIIWGKNLSGIDAYAGSLALGDINNDGKLDLVLVGASPSSDNGVYINNGTTFLKDVVWLDSLPYVGHGLGMGALTLGDLNNDGKLDLIFSGSYSTNFYANVYINNGTSLVDNSSWAGDFIAIFGWPSLTLGDFNNDNKLDLAVIGTRAGDHFEILENGGASFIVNTTEDSGGGACIPGLFDGAIGWGDYDNDGDLDLVAIGKEAGGAMIIEKGITNEWGCAFASDSVAHNNISNGLMQGSLAWVDVDRDKNLDLAINGLDTNTKVSRIYISNRSLTKNNTLPTPPSTFTSNYSNITNTLTLGWNNGSDNETPSTGLYYNLMIGNSTTNNTVVSGVYGGSSNPTAGYFGNMMQRKNITLNIFLPAGTYYWYVQTIDTGLAKSNWSARQTITVSADTTKPIISSVSSSSVTTATATITWTTDEMANSTVRYGTTTATSSSSVDASLIQSHSITLNSLSASTLYYYNVSSCDASRNCNTSIQYSFTTSDVPVTQPASSGGGGGGGTPTPTVNKTITIPEFDIDFSNASSGSLEAKQGDIKTFSFNGEITHKITISELTTTSAKFIIESEPIVLILNIGETKQIDINKDNINDIEIRFISIISGKANFSLTKLSGADIAGKNELGKEALFDAKVSIVNLFQVVKSGREVISQIEVFNVNNIGQTDVKVDYYITDRENKTITEGSDTLAVEAVASFVRSLTVPYNTKAGKYLFNVEVKYNDKVMASSHAEFTVIRNYEIFIVGGIIILIVAGIFAYLWSIKRKENKLESRERKIERKEKRDIRILKSEMRKLKRYKQWQK